MELLSHPSFEDNRGLYTPLKLDLLGIQWSQCSISYNEKKYTFRGMHYQKNPAQTKYIKVFKGSIIDFIYDLETQEVDFIHVNQNSAVLIPNTKAHGFLTLEPETIVAYLVEGEYNPSSEHSLVWSNIPKIKSAILSIVGENEIIISDKDLIGK